MWLACNHLMFVRSDPSNKFMLYFKYKLYKAPTGIYLIM